MDCLQPAPCCFFGLYPMMCLVGLIKQPSAIGAPIDSRALDPSSFIQDDRQHLACFIELMRVPCLEFLVVEGKAAAVGMPCGTNYVVVKHRFSGWVRYT